MSNLAHIYFEGCESGAVGDGVVAGRMGDLRVRFLPATHASAAMLPGEVELHDPLLAWLLQQAGLSARAYRPKALERRLAACLRHLGVPSRTAAREVLAARPELVGSVLNTVLIGVTDFFRDRSVWDQLAREVLPQLLRTRCGLRVYAAGASTGNELYSAAMLLAEAGVIGTSELCGVDCRVDAIAAARAGWFSEAAMARVPPEWCARFFEASWAGYHARPVLTQAMRWQVADLFSFEEVAAWDVILFRNVAIYLTEAHAARAWEYLCDQLSAGGVLMTGKAEKPPQYLPLRRLGPALYQRLSD